MITYLIIKIISKRRKEKEKLQLEYLNELIKGE